MAPPTPARRRYGQARFGDFDPTRSDGDREAGGATPTRTRGRPGPATEGTAAQRTDEATIAADRTGAALSVSELVTDVDRTLGTRYRDVWVKGEVSSFTAHRGSGHWYITLKDDACQLKAVMWRADNARARFQPEVGMELLCRGQVTVYKARGDMQLRVVEVQPVGAGLLQLEFERLKKKLEAEGLFRLERKRPIPKHPRVIGVVTSRDGAALRDIVHVARRRHPGIRLVVVHAQVQGEGASRSIADGILRMNALMGTTNAPDLLIVGRGGGSIEDLWAFNEEPTVRAVAGSLIPVIAAVGHETDTTLTCLAADLRAATPSAAAETAVPDAFGVLDTIEGCEHRLRESLTRLLPELRQRLDERYDRLLLHMHQAVGQRRSRVDDLEPRVCHGLARVLPALQERLDDADGRMLRCLRRALTDRRTRIVESDTRARAAMQRNLADHQHRLDVLAPRLASAGPRFVESERRRWENLTTRLGSVNPLAVLDRGYAAVIKDGEPLVSIDALAPGEVVTLRLQDGEADARIEATRQKDDKQTGKATVHDADETDHHDQEAST